MELFELYLSPIDAKRFKAIVTQSPAGEGETESSLPFFEGEIDRRTTLIKTLETTATFNPKNFQNTGEQEWMVKAAILLADHSAFDPDFLKNIGRSLYQSLFSTGSRVETALQSAIRLAEDKKVQLHIQLKFEADVVQRCRLADYPWELLHDGQRFLLHHQVTISRYIAHDTVPPNLPPVERVNILLVSSAAFDLELGLKRLTKQEQQAIRKGLESVSEAGHIHLAELEYATVNELRTYLTEHRGKDAPHVLHFDGHGLFGKRCPNLECRTIHQGIKAEKCRKCNTLLLDPQGYLVFEDEDGAPDYFSATELGTLLRQSSFGDGSKQSNGVALVVLSACQSAMAVAGDSVFNGTAQNLISHRVPTVVAMQYSVSVEAATNFAEQFYRSLGQKNSLAVAISQGREAIGTEGNQWYRPVLYLRWRDNEGGQLFSGLPDYSKDWSKLLAQTRDNLNTIPDKIGGKVFLPRTKTLQELETAFTKSSAVVLLGPSGCGKTVIAKSWAEKELNTSKAIWWKASSFGVPDFSSFQNRLRLSSPLRDVLAAVSAPRAYVVIDGLDRIFYDAAFQNLSVLIYILRLNVEGSPWQLLIPCQLEEWDRVQMLLARANVLTAKWEILQVNEPSINDFEPVWETFPALERLKFQPQLQSLLLKPKVLDLLATKLSTGGSVDTTQWVGESNLIEWFWDTEVCKQPNARMRVGLLKSLGEKQADNLEAETPTDAFSISDLAQVDSLISDRLCQEREERLSFCHDLYGDWARQRVILGQKNNLREYIKHRVSSPLWHRAVRLYGLHLLEKNEDTAQWRSALVSLCGDDNTPDLTSDLFLEAVVFAANPLPLLERIWADLAANNGLLLRRLLARFLFIATLPNPAILAIASQLDSDLETTAATIQRIPYFPYWLPILQFLHRHLTDVVELAPGHIAEIANTWLRRLDAKWPLRREAAELALATAERLLESTKAGRFFYDKDDLSKKIYHAALAGVYELPDRVANFALKASARKEFTAQKTETETQSEPLIKRVIDDPEYGTYELELDESSWSLIDERGINPIMFKNFSREFGDEEEEEPVAWPDGPSHKVHSAFRLVCLTTDAIFPLIIANPSVAREVILALLIEEPHIHRRASWIYKQGLEIEIVCIQEWSFPFYTEGPFLFFLKNQPQEGLELILCLVNFATERWSDSWQRENQKIPEVLINVENNEYKWIGNQEVYYWYCNHYLCPYPIAVALMALEKWLYDEIDEMKSVNDVLQLILQPSNSVAFAGLLSALARKAPFLLQGVLRLLLTVPEFYLWEYQHRPLSVPYITGMRRYLGQSEEIIELVHEWYELPHRKQGLHQWGQYLFLNTPEMQTFFEEARSHWLKRLQGNSKEDGLKWFLEELVDSHNIENYRIQNYPGHGDFWVFEAPKKLNEKEKALREDSERRLQLLSFPFRCQQILNAGQPLPDEQLEQSWNFLQQIAGFATVEDESGLYDIENSICGSIAVLIQFHWNWLQQYPQREEWCFEQLIKIIHEPPKANKFGYEELNSEWEWDIFCAKIIPLIWSKFPDSNKWRECVALLVTSSRYAVVSTVWHHRAKTEKLYAKAETHVTKGFQRYIFSLTRKGRKLSKLVACFKFQT